MKDQRSMFTQMQGVGPSQKMQIFVKDVGSTGTISIHVVKQDTISCIKDLIQERTKIPREVQFLIFGGKHLQNDKTLEFYDIQKESTLHLAQR